MNSVKRMKEEEAELAERNFANECAAYNQSKRERKPVARNNNEIFWTRRERVFQ